jgi:hypothetical protein
MRLSGNVALVTSILAAMNSGAGGVEVRFAEAADSAVRLACEQLRGHLSGLQAGGRITLVRLEGDDATLGDEGYAIVTMGKRSLDIRAQSDAGLANGVYTLLRTMLIDGLKSPFDRRWAVHERPHFRWRSMMVAPYNFGGAHGFSTFSPDMWAFKHWKLYLDYLRLFNLNVVGIYPMRLYDPEIPESWPNKDRYAIWKQAMDYAHTLGMRFTWVQTANLVHQETWWRHPELRNEREAIWQGCALCYSKARDLIRKTQRHTFEWFKDADHFMLMFTDGGGACFCPECSKDQAGVFLRMVEDTRETLREVGSNADVIFWNWGIDWWHPSMGAGITGYLERYPQVRRIQEEVYERLSKEIVFEDIINVPAIFPQHKEDTLEAARKRGFGTVVGFAYAMNPEMPMFMFPQPRVRAMIDIMQYCKNAGLDGVDGYRLAPFGRILNDFVFMRLAWDPDLTRERLIQEMAGFLARKPENRTKIAEAIIALDAFWEGQEQTANIDKAARLLDEAKAGEASWQLEYVADMTCLLPDVHRLNQPGLTKEEADAVKVRMFAETAKRYILQGFGGTDNQWIPESRMYFNALAGMWAPGHLQALPLTQPGKTD